MSQNVRPMIVPPVHRRVHAPFDTPAAADVFEFTMVRKTNEYDVSDTAIFLDHIYSVAVDPVRMVDLVESWEKQLGQSDAPALYPGNAAAFAGHDQVVDALDKVISAHASRIAELLSGFRTAAFIFNTRGLIVAANDAATAVFRIMPGHRLADLLIDPGDYAPLEDQIVGLVSARECNNAVVRFRQANSRHTVLAHLRAIDAGPSGRHVIMVTSEHKWPDELTRLLSANYEITRQEALVLHYITRGETVADIAQATERSVATIRTQIQSLLQKTRLGSQADLVRLATTLLNAMVSSEFGGIGAQTSKSLPLYTLTPLTLPDGRIIHYRIAGAPDGRPFLLLPSGQGFIRWTDAAEKDMAQRNMQMIVPVRAGFGPSTDCPSDANIYDVAATDMTFLLAHLEVQACPVVAICDDLKIALHMENKHPGIFTHIIGAAATMPLRSSDQFARLTKFVRFIQTNATYAPRTLPYVSLLFFHMARRLGSRRFLETMMASCPADVRALQDPAIAAPLEASTEIVITQHFMAHHSWSREIIEFAKPWSQLLLNCATPISLFSGVIDPFSPIETVREYCALKPAIKLTEVANAGQTLVYTHHSLVLDAVDAAQRATLHE